MGNKVPSKQNSLESRFSEVSEFPEMSFPEDPDGADNETSETHGIGSGPPVVTSDGRPQDRLARTPHNGVNPCTHESQGPSVDPGMPGQPTEEATGGPVSSADHSSSSTRPKEGFRRPPTREVGLKAVALGTLAQSQNGRFCSW